MPTGLLVCLLLLFVDQKNGRDNNTYNGNGNEASGQGGKGMDGEGGEGAIPQAKIQSLNTFLNLQKGDGTDYPKNATGYYRGE